jgi:hypothetical protein
MSLNKFVPDVSSINMAYLLGIFLTDGYAGKEGVRLRTIDKDIAERFCDIGFELFGKCSKIHKFANNSGDKHKRQDFYEVVIYSVQLSRWLKDMTNSKKNIPEFAFQMNDIWLKEFLAGILDGDGWCSVNYKRKNNNPTDRLDWYATIGFCGIKDSYVVQSESLLQSLGVQYSKYTKILDSGLELVEYKIKVSSFIQNSLYFNCNRKQQKVELIKLHSIDQRYNTDWNKRNSK